MCVLCFRLYTLNFQQTSKKMPKVSQPEKYKHPNSRKSKALAKQMKKKHEREKSKLSNNIKLNLLGEKILWFRNNIDTQRSICTPKEIHVIILKYLARFDDELEQIHIKHSIGNRKNRQHASREDVINLTVKREKEEYDTCGLEIPNLLDPTQFNLLKTWNGELRYLPNFRLQRFSKTRLDDEERKQEKLTKSGRPNTDTMVPMSNNCTDETVQENINIQSLPDKAMAETMPASLNMDIGS